MDWKRVSNTVIRSGDYLIWKETVLGELTYMAECAGRLIGWCDDAETAKAVCELHQSQEQAS